MIRRLITKTLDQTSRFARTDMRYVVRGGGWMFAAEIIGSLSLAILALGYAHFLTPEVYGQYKFILAGLGVVGAFSLADLGPAMTRSVAKGFIASLHRAFSTGLKWSLLASLASLVAAGYYFVNDNNVLGLSFLIATFLIPFFLNFALYNNFLLGRRQFALQTKYRIARILIFTGAMVLAIYLFNEPLPIFITYLVTSVILSGVFYYLTSRNVPHDEALVDQEMVPYAKHLTFMSIIGRITTHLDEILTFHYLGPSNLAVYAFALAFPRQIRSFNGVLNNLIFPKITEKSLPELRKILPYKIFLFVGAMSVITVIYIFLAPLGFKLFFPVYLDSILYSQVFALTLIISAPSNFFSQVMLAHRRNKELYTVRIVVPLARIALMLVLIPMYGIWGGIMALMGTEVVILLLYTSLFFKISK